MPSWGRHHAEVWAGAEWQGAARQEDLAASVSPQLPGTAGGATAWSLRFRACGNSWRLSIDELAAPADVDAAGLPDWRDGGDMAPG